MVGAAPAPVLTACPCRAPCGRATPSRGQRVSPPAPVLCRVRRAQSSLGAHTESGREAEGRRAGSDREPVTLDLRVRSSSPSLGEETTLKKKKKKKGVPGWRSPLSIELLVLA